MSHSKVCPLNFSGTQRLPSPRTVREQLPTNKLQEEWILRARHEITEILENRSDKFLMIIGPCSVHDMDAALSYAEKLKRLSTEVSDCFLIAMRVYYEKPRTSLGWKGFLYDPDLNGANDIHKGITLTRELLLELASMHLPAAAELLDPLAVSYCGDLLSWGCVGARTSASQPHRQMASGMRLPIAFKNTTDGNVDIAIHAVQAALNPQSFLSTDFDGTIVSKESMGNPYCHIALRGGNQSPNYDPQSIAAALDKLEQAGLPRRVIVDCSHDNSGRSMELQPFVFQSLLRQYHEGNHAIKGIILESHLHAGNQQLAPDKSALRYAVSVTDPCIDWETTEALVLWAHKLISGKLEECPLSVPAPEQKQPYYVEL